MTPRALISVVDDDESVRESLPDLLKELGFAAQVFTSAEAFLAGSALSATQCLILDINLPGMNGFELKRELSRQNRSIPTIFISAKADPAIRLRALADGAIDCLTKPFSETALIDAVQSALQITEKTPDEMREL